MSAIILLDTSVYLNILDVPEHNQARNAILQTFQQKVVDGDYFFLPLATILETGDHIADLNNGGNRRRFAQILVDDVLQALRGNAPYRPTQFPDRDDFLAWLREFPDYAMRSKKSARIREEGVSLSDLSLIKDWERACKRFAMSRVLIWSLDADLQSYDRVS